MTSCRELPSPLIRPIGSCCQSVNTGDRVEEILSFARVAQTPEIVVLSTQAVKFRSLKSILKGGEVLLQAKSRLALRRGSAPCFRNSKVAEQLPHFDITRSVFVISLLSD